MATIKVTYQSTTRRFSIPSTMTWLDLETKLRDIFSLPLSFKFSLSYIDEEGDIITLSTDLELQEFLSSQSPQSVLKFTLTPDKQQPFVDTFSSNSSNASENDFVSIEKEKFILADNVSEKSDNYFTPPPSISKGKQKEEPAAETSTSAANEQQQEENHELAEQFQALLDQFQDVLSRNPQLVEQSNIVMDQILKNTPVDINQWAELLSSFQPEGYTPPTGAQEGNSREEQHRFGQFPSSFPSPHTLLSNPWIQRIVQDFGKFAKPPTGFNGPWNFSGGREELSQETLKEKLNILHSMGFWEDDVKNEELLKKYNGKIERVVEILIKQQDERVNNNSHEAYNSMEGVVGSQ